MNDFLPITSTLLMIAGAGCFARAYIDYRKKSRAKLRAELQYKFKTCQITAEEMDLLQRLPA